MPKIISNVDILASLNVTGTTTLASDLSGWLKATNGLVSSVTNIAIEDLPTITSAKFRESAGLSVIGRSADSIGTIDDLIAGTDGHVLRRSGTTLGFGTIVAAGLASSSVTAVKIASNAVTAVKIAAGVVSLDKLSNLPAYTIIGNNTDISAVPKALTVADTRTMLQDTNNKFVTDNQINTWDGKQNALTGTTGRVAYFSGTNTIASGVLQDTGSVAAVGMTPVAGIPLSVYNGAILNTTLNSYKTLLSIQGSGTNQNNFMIKDYLLRNTEAGNSWTTTSHINGISIDSSYPTPMVDLRTWIRRDPYPGTILFGNGANTYMTLSPFNTVGNMAVTGTISEAGTLLSGKYAPIAHVSDSVIHVTAGDKINWDGKQNALTNPVTGTGTINYVAKFTATGSAIGNSVIQDNGTHVGIATAPVSGVALTVGGMVYGQGGANFSTTALFERTTVGVSPVGALRVHAKSSVAMADGFGSYLYFTAEGSGGEGRENILGGIGAVRSGGNNSGTLQFRTVNAGAEAVRGSVLPSGEWGILTAPASGVALTIGGITRVTSLTVSQIVETDSSNNLISVAKGTAYNKNFGTGNSDVPRGDAVMYRLGVSVSDLNTFGVNTVRTVTPFSSTMTANGSPVVPSTNYFSGFEFRHNLASDYRTQIATGSSGAVATLSIRNMTAGTWGSWNYIWHTGNFTKATIEDLLTGSITSHTHDYSLSTHVHGSITNDGKIGTESGRIVATTTGGALTVLSAAGTPATQFLRGDGTWVVPTDTNTTYAVIPAQEITDGTASTLRTISGVTAKLIADRNVGTATPLAHGNALVGTSLLYARQDHVHPSDNVNTAIAVDNILQGSNTGTPSVTYAPYATNQSTLARFYTTTNNPTGTTRLNIGANFHATQLFEGGTRVSVTGHTHATTDITSLSSYASFTNYYTKTESDGKYSLIHTHPYESTITKSNGYLTWNGSAWEWKNETYLQANQSISLTGAVTGSGITTIATTLADSIVTNAKFRDSVALSVVGRSTNTAGVVGDIAAGVDGQVLRRSGTAIGFGTIATAGIADNAVSFAKMVDVTGPVVVGRQTATLGDPSELSMTTLRTMLNVADGAQVNPATGNLTEITSSVLTILGGNGAVIGSGTTVQVKQANTSQSGFLSSTDWNTFNGKQAAIGGANNNRVIRRTNAGLIATGSIREADTGLVGIGTDTKTGNDLTVKSRLVVGERIASGQNPAISMEREVTGATNGHGIQDYSTINLGLGLAYAAYDVRCVINGSENLDHFGSYQSIINYNNSGLMDRFNGFLSSVIVNAGTIDKIYHNRVVDTTGTGAVNNQYGLYIHSLIKGSVSNYAIYTDGETSSRFGGNIAIGVTPKSWDTVNRTLQVGSAGAVVGNTENNAIQIASGVRWLDSAWKSLGSNLKGSIIRAFDGAITLRTTLATEVGGVATVTDVMTVNSNGMGILTTPVAGVALNVKSKIQVTDGAGTPTNMQMYSNSTAGYIGTVMNKPLVLIANNVEMANITDAGFGIGWSPHATARLTVGGNARVQDGEIHVGWIGTNTSRTYTILSAFGHENSGGTKYGNVSIKSNYDHNSNAADMRFFVGTGGTATAEAMMISSGRNVTINSPVSGVALTVNGDIIGKNGLTVPRVFRTSHFGNGSLKVIPITHNLNSFDVIVQVCTDSDPRETVFCDVTRTSLNGVTLTFATAPTYGQYAVVVIG